MTRDKLLVRQATFAEAEKMVKPIVEEHGFEPYTAGSPAFSGGSTFTKVEQHLDAIIRVADWLMEE